MPNLRGLLFAVIALALAGVAVSAWRAGSRVIALAAIVLAAWMGDLALRDLGVLGRRR
jgi:Na+/H+ antiporter NhaC